MIIEPQKFGDDEVRLRVYGCKGPDCDILLSDILPEVIGSIYAAQRHVEEKSERAAMTFVETGITPVSIPYVEFVITAGPWDAPEAGYAA
jgi:hypothetical protein